jgi:lipooligosaccharide transport system ATP-binding protein
VLVGTAAGFVEGTRQYDTEAVPHDTIVIHGSADETVPLANVLDWALPLDLPVVVVPGADHFFHRRLHQIRDIVTRALAALTLSAPAAASQLRKTYAGTEVVAGLSFAVEPGTCFGLLGPNGAGKTTTLAPLPGPDRAGQRRHHPQRPCHSGRCPKGAGASRCRAAVRQPRPRFHRQRKPARLRPLLRFPDAEIKERIPQLLEFASLASKADARIATLSGGMKRRLTLARALVNNPDIIFLDEPTTGLDPQARHLIWDRLKQLKSAGKTLILTTHFMDEAERLCDTLIVIDHGRKIAEGSPRQLIAEQIEPQVVEVFDEAPATCPPSSTPTAAGRARRNQRRNRLLLLPRTARLAGQTGRRRRPALRAPRLQSGRRLHQADRAGIARLAGGRAFVQRLAFSANLRRS